jgi:hypothetical protein
MSIFNKDNTRLWVMPTIGGSNKIELFDFDPGAFTASNRRQMTTNSPAGDGLQKDLQWSGLDPNILLVHDYGNRLYTYNVSTQTFTLLKDFSNLIEPGGGVTQMTKSMNDDVFAFTLTQTPTSGFIGYLVWKRSTNEVLLRQLAPNVDEVLLDKGGRYLNVQTTGTNDTVIWDLQTKTSTKLPFNTLGYRHVDAGYGTIFTAQWNDDYAFRSLATPTTFTSILPGYISYNTQQDHFSMLADNEGWALVARYSTSGGPVLKAFDNEIFQVATDGSNQVRRLAHHRSVYNDYNDTTRANISRDGQFVAFTSNWGNADGRRDVYIVQVPPA